MEDLDLMGKSHLIGEFRILERKKKESITPDPC